MSRRNGLFSLTSQRGGDVQEASRARTRRDRRRRFRCQPESLESRELLTTITRSGGVGGISESLALPGDLNIVQFNWQNYTIKDEFQVQLGGQRIAGDVGLQSGGRSGTTLVSKTGSVSSLTVKVTAPTQGTAWDFTVSVNPFELEVDALLGDVTKIDLAPLFQAASSRTFASVGLDPSTFQFVSMTNAKGKVAEIDNWQDELKNGVFYFVPTVTGTPLDYLATHTTDAGLGESELRVRGTITDDGGTTRQVEIPIQIRVTDGFSTSGDNGANGSGTTKLDIYRQQQRLAYLGYPGANGNPLVVDGATGNNTTHAMRMFSVATAAGYPPPGVLTANTNAFKAYINSANAPAWINMSSIAGVNWYSARRYGVPQTGSLLADAQTALGVTINSGGSALLIGNAPPSVSHDAGRGFDIDNIPDTYLFRTVGYAGVAGGFVRAPGPAGSIVVQDGNTYRVGSVNNAADRANGVRASTLNGSTTATLVTTLHNLGLLEFTEPEATVRGVLEAFVNAGANRIFYNDPRFIGTAVGGVTVGFARNHFNHMHFNIPSPTAQPGPVPAPAPASPTGLAALAAFSVFAPIPAAPPAIDLGTLTAPQTVTGSVGTNNPEQLYGFVIGEPERVYEENFFDTPRDVVLNLSGLTADADLQLVYDLNENGVIDPDEVLYDSATSGLSPESLTALQLPSGVYYVRVIGQASDTPFSLTLEPVALPVPPDGAGDTVATAAHLGTLAGTLNRSDFIGEVDPQDLYTFTIAAMSDVTVHLNGLDQADAMLALGQDLNGDGVLTLDEVLAYSNEEGNGAESLRLIRLAAGNYLVQVLRGSGNSEYQLQASATPSTVPTDQAGSTVATARDLGAVSGVLTANDFVGGVDPVDLYRFQVTAVTGLKIELTGLSADADLQVYRDLDGNGVLSASELVAQSDAGGTDAEEIILAGLNPGSYFLRVGRFEGDTEYALALTPQDATGADLVVSRTGATDSADLGSQLIYTVTVTNNGPDAATNVLLTEKLASGLAYVRASASPSVASIQSTSDGFRGRITTLAPGASVTFTVTAFTFIAGQIPTTTTVTSDTADFDASNNVLNDLKVINPIASPPADLELTQSVSDTEPEVGDTITISMNLFNRGPGTATDIQVRNLLPAGLSYVSSSADLGTYDATTGVWDVGNLLPNAGYVLRITATVTAARSLTNTAEIVAVAERDPDSTPNNNQPGEDDQTTITILPVGATANLGLVQSLSTTTPAVGDRLTVTLTVKNGGPGAATGLLVHDLLPAGLTLVRAEPSTGQYVPSTGRWTIGDLASGGSATLRLTVTVAAEGSLTNVATIAGLDQADPDPADNTARATIHVQSGDRIGPQVVDLQRFGVLQNQTAYVLTFNEPLDPARARDLGNYQLVDPGRDGRFGTRDDRTVPIRSVDYAAGGLTVTLTPAVRIPLNQRLRLTLNGSSATGLADVLGNRLDGDADGRVGGDYSVTVRGFNLGPASIQGRALRPLDADRDGKVTVQDLRVIRERRKLPVVTTIARRTPVVTRIARRVPVATALARRMPVVPSR